MANLLWGKVYYNDTFAGLLREEPADSTSFTYDDSYLNAGLPAISHSMPLRETPYISYSALHPFFDNLVAEGWLEHAQTALLGKRSVSRFELLLAFGFDCAGAVSVIDPEPAGLSEILLDKTDSKEMAVLTSRASLSGVQAKLAVIQRDGKYFPAKMGEISSHIAKFHSPQHPDLILNEYLSTQAFKALLPNDPVVELSINTVEGLPESALIIKRFDRSPEGRLHFEEFNQLLERKSSAKYEGSHKEMSDFIKKTPGCIPTEAYLLFGRILAGILIGNTDMHFKNFAMLHTRNGLRLTPSYDEVCAYLYQYKSMALSIGGSRNLKLGALKAKNIITLGGEFELSHAAIQMMCDQLEKNIETAKQAIENSPFGKEELKNKLIQLMENRWKATFALIGRSLLKKP
jgi:serine/threonine-protein kinase HipA